MLDFSREHKTIDKFPGGEPIDNEQLFALDADVLIPAALENQITAENAGSIRAKIVIEAANGPTTPEAHKILHERGAFVVPDILANSGGVTVSYFEWVQDRYGYFWEEREVNERLERKMVEAFDDVLQTSLKSKTTSAPPPTSSPSRASAPSRRCAGCTPDRSLARRHAAETRADRPSTTAVAPAPESARRDPTA